MQQKIQNNQRQQHHRRVKLESPLFLVLAAMGLIGGALLPRLRRPNPQQLIPISVRVGGTRRPELDLPPAESHPPLRHVARRPAAVPGRGVRVVPRPPLARAEQFPGLRAGARLADVGRAESGWQDAFPGGGPQVGPDCAKDAPDLHAHTVRYRNQLSQADELLRHYRTEPDCGANNSFLRGNHKCRLALNMLADEVYDTEWDMIMVDAPRGYFAEAPGRMAAIYSAAVMARNRKRPGVTHVFLHDVDRKVEKMYAEAFLCKKHLVKAVGRLWHFQIPPQPSLNAPDFC